MAAPAPQHWCTVSVSRQIKDLYWPTLKEIVIFDQSEAAYLSLQRSWVDISNEDIPISSVVDPDSDPHGSGTFAWIRIQQKVKEHINKTVNSGLFVLLDSSIE